MLLIGFTIILALIAFIILILLMFPIVKVKGDSMYPTLKEGRVLISTRLFNKNNCKVNKLYVIHLKDDESGSPYYIIKRLKGITKRGDKVLYDFRGDNFLVSYDSRQHGLFDSSEVEAKVLGDFKNKTVKVTRKEINK